MPLLLLGVFWLNESFIRIESCKSYELIPSFIKQHPVSLNLLLHSKLGIKHGKTKAQRQGDFKVILIRNMSIDSCMEENLHSDKL